MNVRVAGVGSVLPAKVALTEKVCEPSDRAVSTFGDEHGPNATPSSLHSKVDPGSVEENSKLAVLDLVVPDGPEVIDVSGGVVFGAVVSTVQVRVAGEGSTLPAASFALTENVWDPPESPVKAFGEEHDANSPASSLHSKVDPDSVEANSKLALEFVVPEGPEVIKVSGGVVSGTVVLTVQVRVAGDGSTLPAPSLARTENVC